MRTLPSDITARLSMTRQTRANNADPRSSIWISRPTIPLTDQNFIERQTLGGVSNVTDVSIAVCHPKVGGTNTKTFIAYIENGIAKVKSAVEKYNINSYLWNDENFNEPADSISIAFDGTMPKAVSGEVEFITENYPWIFWTKDGVMYAWQLNTNAQPVILAEANCTDVSAIRAMWSSTGGYDFGLVAFFIVNGYLYYRQYINHEWMDAELVTFGPVTNTWSEIAAFRTWDYRVGVQGKTTSGDIYEYFTQFMGIGKQNAEHVEVDIGAKATLARVKHYNTSQPEHIEISVSAGAPHGGLYSVHQPTAVSLQNLSTEDDDWGKLVELTVDNYLFSDEVAAHVSNFTLVDSIGTVYAPMSAELQDDDQTILFTFYDFNNAKGSCRLVYTPGTLQTIAGTVITRQEYSFIPVNLVPSEVPVPVVDEIWNV